MKALVVGATGFTGSYVVPLLLKNNMSVRCLVRRSSDTSVMPVEKVELTYGDLNDKVSIEQALRGVDVLINVASLGFGHAPGIVEAALAAGLRRAVFFSTSAVFTQLNVASKFVRLAAEETIRKSGLAYTILRPTMIYGSSRDRNMCRLIRYLGHWPAIPIFGSGDCLQQPVYVEDVATAVLQSLSAAQTIGRSYNLSGALPLTYNQIINTVCELLGRKVRKIRLPAAPIVAGLTVLESLSLRLPIKAEQILRLNENKAFSHDEAAMDFHYKPRSFAEGIRLELAEMG